MIALSHPLTINCGLGFRRRTSGRKEGRRIQREQAEDRRTSVCEENNNIESVFFFPREVVKGQREGEGEGLHMAKTSSSVDVGSEASLTVRSAQRRCMFRGEKDRVWKCSTC